MPTYSEIQTSNPIDFNAMDGTELTVLQDKAGISGGINSADMQQFYSAAQVVRPGLTQTEIQAKLDLGGRVIFSPGTYNFSLIGNDHCLQVNTSRTQVILAEGAVLKLADNQYNTASDIGYVIWVGDGTTPISDIYIQGPGIVDGNRANQPHNQPAVPIQARGGIGVRGPATDVTVFGAEVVAVAGDGIVAAGTSPVSTNLRPQRISFRNSTVSDVLEGILSVYCDFVDIIGNTVTDTQGVSPQDGIEPANTTNFQIIANTIQNCGQQGIDIFDLCVDGVVSHNIINDCELDCITFGGDSLGNQRVVITSNICQGSVNGNGIGTLINSIPSEQVIIVGNTIQNVNDGIFVNQNSFGVVVANNTIDTAASTGIDIRSIDTIVANNVIRDFGTGLGSGRYGILLQFASGCEIIGNTVRDTQATKTSQHGIYMLNGSVGNAILSNTVSDCGEHGIYIQSDTNRVEANSIIDIGHNVANRSGIFIQASNCTVKDNYCANPGAVANYSFGIQNSSGDNNIIQSNTITNGLVLEGIRIASGTGAVVNGNQMAAFNLNDQGINTLITNNNMAAIVGTSGGGRQAQINFISGVWTP